MAEAAERTIELPTPVERTPGSGGENYVVIVFNNDHNTFDEVIAILQLATGCPREEAEMETWEIHNRGRSLVHYGDQPECERAARIIRRIGIRVTVDEM